MHITNYFNSQLYAALCAEADELAGVPNKLNRAEPGSFLICHFVINEPSQGFERASRVGSISTSFFRITQYIGDTHNALTLIPMNTRTQTLPLGASLKTVPANPQDWQSHHRRLAIDGNVAYHWKHKRRYILRNSLPQEVDPRAWGGTEAQCNH
jgi:hypothetical protein